jgi:hypothetical protein
VAVARRLPFATPFSHDNVTCDLSRFDLGEMMRCSQGLRASSAGSASMEGSARATCEFLYNELTDPEGNRASALVRCYKTHDYGSLPHDIQRYAKRALGAVAISPPDPAMKCLVLMATVGQEPAWNDRTTSKGHQAIPLPSPHIVERAPMIAQLVQELGFDISQVIRPSAGLVRDLAGKTYGVFHVEHAAASPFIPAQATFVEPYGIRSVLGFGGALPSGEIFAMIVFSKVHISLAAADRFRSLALDLKSCLLPFENAVFTRA